MKINITNWKVTQEIVEKCQACGINHVSLLANGVISTVGATGKAHVAIIVKICPFHVLVRPLTSKPVPRKGKVIVTVLFSAHGHRHVVGMLGSFSKVKGYTGCWFRVLSRNWIQSIALKPFY